MTPVDKSLLTISPANPVLRDLRSPMTLVAAVGALLLVIAGIAMVHFSEQSYREAKLQQIDAQGRILASTVTAALAFDDRAAAQEYVNALRRRPPDPDRRGLRRRGQPVRGARA